jgi:hypothetical protein
VAHGKGRLAQLFLYVRSVDAALDARGLAHRVDFQHLVHVTHRDRHDFLESAGRLDALYH